MSTDVDLAITGGWDLFHLFYSFIRFNHYHWCRHCMLGGTWARLLERDSRERAPTAKYLEGYVTRRLLGYLDSGASAKHSHLVAKTWSVLLSPAQSASTAGRAERGEHNSVFDDRLHVCGLNV